MSDSNVIQIRDAQGNAKYPITEKSLVIGLQDVPFESYVVAWDGASTPTVANIPAGVVVNYNGTNYTGTLAASASTAPYLYLVASTSQQGEYDRYITTRSGSSYVWTALGSTAPVSPVIADNLTTNDSSKALSAKQGKILGESVEELELKVDGITPTTLSTSVPQGTTATSIIYDCDFKQGDKITITPTRGEGLTADFSVKYTFFNDSSYSQQESKDVTTGQTDTITLTRNSLKIRVYILNSAVSGSGTLSSLLQVNAGESISEHITAIEGDIAALETFQASAEKDLAETKVLNDDVVGNELLNLIDNAHLIDGYISPTDGGERTGGTNKRTDYIFLKKDIKYFFGRLNSSYYAFYDLNKVHLSGVSYFHHINYNHGYIQCDRDCYFRGTISDIDLSSIAYISGIVDGFVPYGEKNFAEGQYYGAITKPMSSVSPNLFNGRSEPGGIQPGNGQLYDSSAIIARRTLPIYCSGTIYVKMFNGKTGDILYIHEYQADGTWVKVTMVYTTVTEIVLSVNTAFIRIGTTTQSEEYTVPTEDFFKYHLFVTNDAGVFGKWLEKGRIVCTKDVDDHFFDTASTFEADYIKPALDSYIQTIKRTGYDVVIPCMTDIHTDFAEPYKMLNYLAASGVANVCFNLGDTIRENYPSLKNDALLALENPFRWDESKPRKCGVYNLRGNHDTNPVSSEALMISTKEYASIAENRTLKGYASGALNYGYIDLDGKVRLIWLDTSDIFADDGSAILFGNYTLIRQEQLDWLCHDALDFSDKADPENWIVFLFSHDGAKDLRLAPIIEAFVTGGSASGSITYDARKAVDMETDVTTIVTYSVDFTEQGPVTMPCCICGHYHKDKIEEIGTSGVKQVYIACDNVVAHYDDNGTDKTYDRTPGTIEEHICDTLCLDRYAKTVTFKRLGVGSDRVVSYD